MLLHSLDKLTRIVSTLLWKMASKLLLLGLVLVATTVLILSEVSARDLSEETGESKTGFMLFYPSYSSFCKQVLKTYISLQRDIKQRYILVQDRRSKRHK